MAKKREINEYSTDPAAQEMLKRAEELGIGTAFTRADNMAPCNIGGAGMCCKQCGMGPCRLTKDGQVGVCGATIDTITFAPAVIDVGDSTPVAGTGGDAAAGSGASVRLVSNSGQITITETNDTSNGLEGGAGDIALSEISVTSDDANLGTPTLSNSGGGTSTPVLNGGNVTNRSAVWTYAYNNTTIPEADNYDVEITYTATSL